MQFTLKATAKIPVSEVKIIPCRIKPNQVNDLKKVGSADRGIFVLGFISNLQGMRRMEQYLL